MKIKKKLVGDSCKRSVNNAISEKKVDVLTFISSDIGRNNA